MIRFKTVLSLKANLRSHKEQQIQKILIVEETFTQTSLSAEAPSVHINTGSFLAMNQSRSTLLQSLICYQMNKVDPSKTPSICFLHYVTV